MSSVRTPLVASLADSRRVLPTSGSLPRTVSAGLLPRKRATHPPSHLLPPRAGTPGGGRRALEWLPPSSLELLRTEKEAVPLAKDALMSEWLHEFQGGTQHFNSSALFLEVQLRQALAATSSSSSSSQPDAFRTATVCECLSRLPEAAGSFSRILQVRLMPRRSPPRMHRACARAYAPRPWDEALSPSALRGCRSFVPSCCARSTRITMRSRRTATGRPTRRGSLARRRTSVARSSCATSTRSCRRAPRSRSTRSPSRRPHTFHPRPSRIHAHTPRVHASRELTRQPLASHRTGSSRSRRRARRSRPKPRRGRRCCGLRSSGGTR